MINDSVPALRGAGAGSSSPNARSSSLLVSACCQFMWFFFIVFTMLCCQLPLIADTIACNGMFLGHDHMVQPDTREKVIDLEVSLSHNLRVHSKFPLYIRGPTVSLNNEWLFHTWKC